MLTQISPRHLKVSLAILLVPAVPLIAALVLSVWQIWERNAQLQSLTVMHDLIAPVVYLSDAVHEQQKERGSSSIVIGSGGREFTAELAKQRLRTSERQTLLFELLEQNNLGDYDAALGRQVTELREHVARQADLRARVDRLEIGAAEALAYYTTMNAQMLEIIHTISNLNTDHEVSVAINGFYNFLQGKERAGIERAVGSFGFTQGRFTLEGLLKLQGLIATQDAYFSNFVGEAAPAYVTQYETLVASDAAKTVAAMRDLAFTRGLAGDISQFSGGDFFDAMTVKINFLKEIEVSQGIGIEALMGDHVALARVARNSMIVVTGIGGLLVLAVTIAVAGAIRSGFLEVRNVAGALASGEYETVWPAARRNEFGEIMSTLGVLRDHSISNRDRAAQDLKDAEASAKAEREAQEEQARVAARQAKEEREAGAKREAAAAAEREITMQIAKMVSSCAQGEFDQRISVETSSKSLSDICDGMNRICETVEQGLDEINTAMGAMARGDMTHRMTRDTQGSFARIQARINDTTEALAASFTSVQHSSETIEGSAREIASASQDLASRTEQSAMKLEQTSNAITSLSASVQSTAKTARTANAEAAAAMEKVEAGDRLVETTIGAIREIKDSSTAIGTAIQLIDDITFQTNLLALNAGVEAARAG